MACPTQALPCEEQVPAPNVFTQHSLLVRAHEVLPQSGTPASSYMTLLGTLPPPLELVDPESRPDPLPLLLPELELDDDEPPPSGVGPAASSPA
jgi:hypothetical protein